MKAKLTKGQAVTLIRNAMGHLLAAPLPSFVFFNSGVVEATSDSRVGVSWPSHGVLWFDRECVQPSNSPSLSP